jgi:hypothetical protein
MSNTTARRTARAIPVALTAAALASTAQAGVDISTRPTQNMSCSAGICTATAKRAYLNVNDVTSMLAAGNLKIATGSGAEDIHVDAAFSWTSPSRLTLDAQRSIEFRKSVTVAGTGALTLVTNDGGTGGDYWFDAGASLTFWDRKSNLVVESLTLTLVPGLKTLIGDIAHNPLGHYALARDYDAGADGTYASSPIPTSFGGSFEGLGNTISHLSILDTTAGDNVGLFAAIGKQGVVRDVRLARIRVTGGKRAHIGALVGTNRYGTLVRDEVDGGDVIAEGGNLAFIGGLVGENGLRLSGSAIIIQSSTSATVSAASEDLINVLAGGIAGVNYGTIIQSSARGNVRNADIAGGLVGENLGARIDSSYATGAVTDLHQGACLGGLVAIASGTISGSHATGAVTAADDAGAGGLACAVFNFGAIVRSFASGSVTVGNKVQYSPEAGGLVGGAGCSYTAYIDTSFATGAVLGGSGAQVGGLEGRECGTTTQNSYATGEVMALRNSSAGGLVGHRSNGTFQRSYSVGRLSVGENSAIGGLIGTDHFAKGHIQFAYWDVDASGTTRACGSDSCSGGTGLTTSQFQSGLPDGFDPTIWGQNPSINGGYPYLLANPPQ